MTWHVEAFSKLRTEANTDRRALAFLSKSFVAAVGEPAPPTPPSSRVVATRFMGSPAIQRWKGETDDAAKALDDAMPAVNDAAAAIAMTQARRVLENVLILLSLQLLLFLYLIFFVNLRGAVESLIEGLAIEEEERARTAAVSGPSILTIKPTGETTVEGQSAA